MSNKKSKRWNAKRKAELVIRLLKGESLEELSRESGQPAHVISEWRETFLQSAEAGLKGKSNPSQPNSDPASTEIRQLKTKIGSLVMDNDLLYEKISQLENGIPFHLRKSKD